MHRPAKLAHNVYNTNRLEEMRDWYALVLGAWVAYENPMICFMTFDDEHHRIALARMGQYQEPDPDAWGLNHTAYTYAEVGHLLENYLRLGEHDIHPWWTIHHGPTLSFYYRDPDGNAVELQVDAKTPAEIDEFVRSETFAANPIGIDVDPDDLVARWKAGATDEELLAYG